MIKNYLVKHRVKLNALSAVSISIIIHFHLHACLGTVGTNAGTLCIQTVLTTKLKSLKVLPQSITIAPTLEALVTLLFNLGNQLLQKIQIQLNKDT